MPESMTPEYVRRQQNPWGNVTLVDGVNKHYFRQAMRAPPTNPTHRQGICY